MNKQELYNLIKLQPNTKFDEQNTYLQEVRNLANNLNTSYFKPEFISEIEDIRNELNRMYVPESYFPLNDDEVNELLNDVNRLYQGVENTRNFTKLKES